MADLEVVLSWLGMSQYLDRFVQAGFDSWEMLQEITEEDLELLEVGLGYRRKLQREIANARKQHQGLSAQSLQRVPRQANVITPMERLDPMLSPTQEDEIVEPDLPTKRSYRHHPKPDISAPERPYSAYVMFSNEMREQLKDENLSFPELSRQVGIRWQGLSPEEKEHWKQLAAKPWEVYKEKVLAYQQTDQYREYKKYVEDFKAAQAVKQRGRPKQPLRGSFSSNVYPTPGQTPSASTTRALSSSHASLNPVTLPPSSSRMPTSSDSVSGLYPARWQLPNKGRVPGVSSTIERPKSCESCKQRRSKCTKQRPTCGRCAELGLLCNYAESPGDADSDRILALSRKLDEFTRLLNRIKPQLRSEDQQAVQAALRDSPSTTSSFVPHSSARPQASRRTTSRNESSEDKEEESDDSEHSVAGSMGSVHHVNQDDFGNETAEMHARAFMGNGSDLQWLRRLHAELDGVGQGSDRPSRGTLPQLKAHFNSFFAEDMDQAVIGDQIDPFGLPIKSTADQLVSSFFSTVHLSLPLLDRATFMRQYKLLSSTWYAETFEDRMFITMLQLVFAIGAVHAHLSGVESILDDRDHLLYSARARMLAVDSGIMNDVARLAQVQVFALGAMYSLVSERLDRSWYLAGLAIRCAQSLGMHLENVTPSMSIAEKQFQARIWFALVALERCLCMITGRPTMVREGACTVSLPPVEPIDATLSKKSAGRSAASQLQGMAAEGSSGAQFDTTRRPSQTLSPIENAFFRRYLELTDLTNDVLSHLYAPEIREEVSAEVHSLIEGFDKRLIMWHNKLEDSFKMSPGELGGDVTLASYNAALTLFFHTIRIIINRPCVCKIDGRQVPEASRSAILRCMLAARKIITLLRTAPLSVLLHQSPMWWMLFHHHKRALTIIVLELAFRAEHMPSQTEELLADAKSGVEWAGKMAGTSNAAQFTCVTIGRYLQLAARRVGADVGLLGADLKFSSSLSLADSKGSLPPADPQEELPQPSQSYQARGTQQQPQPQPQPQAPPQSGFGSSFMQTSTAGFYDPLSLDSTMVDPFQTYSTFQAETVSAFHSDPFTPTSQGQMQPGHAPSAFPRYAFQPPQQYQQQGGLAGQGANVDASASKESSAYPGDEFIDYGE